MKVAIPPSSACHHRFRGSHATTDGRMKRASATAKSAKETQTSASIISARRSPSRMHPIAVLLLSAALVGNHNMMLQPVSAAAHDATTADDTNIVGKKKDGKSMINYYVALRRRAASGGGDDLDDDEKEDVAALDDGLQTFAIDSNQRAAGTSSSSSPEEMAVFRKAKKVGPAAFGANSQKSPKSTKATKENEKKSTTQPTLMPSASPSLEPSLASSATPSLMPTMTPCATDDERTSFINDRINGCSNGSGTVTDSKCKKLTDALTLKPSLMDYFICASKDSIINFNKIKEDPGMLKQLEQAAAVVGVEYFTGTAAQVKAMCDAARENDVTVVCCSGFNACVDWHNDRIRTVASDSCEGSESCKSMGGEALILSNSCKGQKACERLGNTFSNGPNDALKSNGIVLIGPDSCNDGKYACRSFGGYVTGIKTVAKGSCTADRACQGVGYHDTLDASNNNTFNIRVGEDSCTANYACTHVNVLSYAETTVGDGSCTNEKACRYVGRGSKFKLPLVIDDETCVTDNECALCGSNVAVCRAGQSFILTNEGGQQVANCITNPWMFCVAP